MVPSRVRVTLDDIDGISQRSKEIMKNKAAKQALNQFKMQAASEVGVNLKQGYNGDLTSRQAGSIGGQMVKKMIMSYEQNLSK
jgi:hypothetical protein